MDQLKYESCELIELSNECHRVVPRILSYRVTSERVPQPRYSFREHCGGLTFSTSTRSL